MLKDQISHYKHELLFADALTAENSPDGVDLQGFASCTFVCAVGEMDSVGGSPEESWELKMEESDDNSTFSVVDGDDMLLEFGKNDGSASSGVFATIDAADEDDAVYTAGYAGSKRYARVVAVPSNSPGSTPISVVAVKGALQKPQAD